MDGVLADFEKGIADYGVVSENIDIGGHFKREIDWDKFKGENIADNVYYKLEPFKNMIALARKLKNDGYNVEVITGLPRSKDPLRNERGDIVYRNDKYGKQVPVYKPCEASEAAKRAWLDKNGLADIKMTGCFAYRKAGYMVDNSILIDDKADNCDRWNRAAAKKGLNSTACLHTDWIKTVNNIYSFINERLPEPENLPGNYISELTV